MDEKQNIPKLPDIIGADGIFYSPDEVLIKFFTEQEL
jgi:hypothetical protein